MLRELVKMLEATEEHGGVVRFTLGALDLQGRRAAELRFGSGQESGQVVFVGRGGHEHVLPFETAARRFLQELELQQREHELELQRKKHG